MNNEISIGNQSMNEFSMSKQSSFGLKKAAQKLNDTPFSQSARESEKMMSIQGGVSDTNQTPNPNNYASIAIKESQQWISDLKMTH